MKKKYVCSLAGILVGLSLIVGLTGCESPPTKIETRLFDIETNYVPKVVTHFITNTITVTDKVTGAVSPFPIIVEESKTNLVPVGYRYAPKENFEKVLDGVGEVGGGVFGVGGLLSTLFVGAAGVYARIRSKKNEAALVQAIEVGREIMSQTPQGKRLKGTYTEWMMRNQAATGVINGIAKAVDKHVNNDAAKSAARFVVDETLEAVGGSGDGGKTPQKPGLGSPGTPKI